MATRPTTTARGEIYIYVYSRAEIDLVGGPQAISISSRSRRRARVLRAVHTAGMAAHPSLQAPERSRSVSSPTVQRKRKAEMPAKEAQSAAAAASHSAKKRRSTPWSASVLTCTCKTCASALVATMLVRTANTPSSLVVYRMQGGVPKYQVNTIAMARTARELPRAASERASSVGKAAAPTKESASGLRRRRVGDTVGDHATVYVK